ncbi:VOC family protein [Acidisoma cellulosilytica]|uniref:VOC family protein n=1 Tax=Acidisoma cellulosilyticum TaxID=2802395 RepID=A0A963Z704_9PROT|nr:VOC family protein [Acidisoma cellulosilyticum]MCB8883676.1 VOC family protein [Acidisoma cellulosilyticum]
MSPVTRIARISITVSNLERISRFYCDALGFSVIAVSETVMGEFPGHRMCLQLGDEILELFQPLILGSPYPSPRAATDPWFQHIAIVVSDINSAYACLQHFDFEPITVGGPQQLPPSSGGVKAFKFRDPDGHPLELIEFPPSSGDPKWLTKSSAALFLGYDHTAITVQNVEESLAYYEGLGFTALSRGINHGVEQGNLDDTPNPIVDVVALVTASSRTPHLELLSYRAPKTEFALQMFGIGDIASVRIVLDTSETDRFDEISVKPTQDPDGHLLMLKTGSK